MKKRIISLILAVVMLFAVTVPAAAASEDAAPAGINIRAGADFVKTLISGVNSDSIVDSILSSEIADKILDGSLTAASVIFKGIDVENLIPEQLTNEATERIVTILSLLSRLSVSYSELDDESKAAMRAMITGVVKAYISSIISGADELIRTYIPVIGDADADGIVSILDATCIQRLLAGLDGAVNKAKLFLDFDGDGEITILDATAIQRYLCDLFSPDDDPDEPVEPEQPEEPAEPVSLEEMQAMQTLGEIFALCERQGLSWDQDEIIYVFEYNDRVYRVYAVYTEEIDAAYRALDFFSDDYDEASYAVFGTAEITSVEDITSYKVIDIILASMIGKTGQDLMAIGFTPAGSYGEQEGLFMYEMAYGPFCYRVYFNEIPADMEAFGENEDISTFTVNSIEYSDISNNAYEFKTEDVYED